MQLHSGRSAAVAATRGTMLCAVCAQSCVVQKCGLIDGCAPQNGGDGGRRRRRRSNVEQPQHRHTYIFRAGVVVAQLHEQLLQLLAGRHRLLDALLQLQAELVQTERRVQRLGGLDRILGGQLHDLVGRAAVAVLAVVAAVEIGAARRQRAGGCRGRCRGDRTTVGRVGRVARGRRRHRRRGGRWRVHRGRRGAAGVDRRRLRVSQLAVAVGVGGRVRHLGGRVSMVRMMVEVATDGRLLVGGMMLVSGRLLHGLMVRGHRLTLSAGSTAAIAADRGVRIGRGRRGQRMQVRLMVVPRVMRMQRMVVHGGGLVLVLGAQLGVCRRRRVAGLIVMGQMVRLVVVVVVMVVLHVIRDVAAGVVVVILGAGWEFRLDGSGAHGVMVRSHDERAHCVVLCGKTVCTRTTLKPVRETTAENCVHKENARVTRFAQTITKQCRLCTCV